jgi:uncharacterized RDD family membrane protein YckC
MTDAGPNPSGAGVSGGSAGTGRMNSSFEVKPHVYDPAANPELFEGVLARRVIAFIIDVIILALPLIAAWLFIFVLGILTLGLGWALFWALLYYGTTLGGPRSATIGMRAMEIEMHTWYGAPAYFVLGAVHAIVYWITVSVLSPLILIVGFFNTRGRLLHDFLVGTVLINNPNRAALLRSRQVH